MNRNHSPEHELMLAELLGEADAATPRAIASCPECRELLAGMRQLAGQVAAAARQEQALLAAAERMDPAAAEHAARAFAAQHLQGPPARRRRQWGRLTAIALVAAAGLLAMLLWPRGAEPADLAQRKGPVLLGPGDLRLDHPVGVVTRYAPFTWEGVEGTGIAYELTIWEDAADGRHTLIRRLSLETTTWDPEAARLVLPDHISWKVEVTDATRSLRRQGSASSSLTPR